MVNIMGFKSYFWLQYIIESLSCNIIIIIMIIYLFKVGYYDDSQKLIEINYVTGILKNIKRYYLIIKSYNSTNVP